MVAVTSVFAGLLKPMWLSLICTKLKSALFSPRSPRPSACDTGTPPAKVHTRPVPAHAMHFKNPRRSIPSPLPLFVSLTLSPLRDRRPPAAHENCTRRCFIPQPCSVPHVRDVLDRKSVV